MEVRVTKANTRTAVRQPAHREVVLAVKPAFEAARAMGTQVERDAAMVSVESAMAGLCRVLGRAGLQRLLDECGFEGIDSLQLARRAAAQLARSPRYTRKGRAA